MGTDMDNGFNGRLKIKREMVDNLIKKGLPQEDVGTKAIKKKKLIGICYDAYNDAFNFFFG